MKEVRIGKNDAGQRVDRFLKKFLQKGTSGFIYKMIRKKKIKVNNKRAEPCYILEQDDTIQFYFAQDILERLTFESKVVKTDTEFNIVYQDDNIIVVDKPTGLLSHTDGKHNALIDQIRYYLTEKREYDPYGEKSFTPALCNRLDRNTGGLVIAAKNSAALRDMNYMIREKWVEKGYMTVVAGRVHSERLVEGFLIKDVDTNRVTISDTPTAGGKAVKMWFAPQKYSDNGYTLLDVRLITGKPHQIRAQLAHEGYPIIGDYKYGNTEINRHFREEYGLKHQLLYANRIAFTDTTPMFDYLKGMEITDDLPVQLREVVSKLFRLYEQV